MNMLNFGVSQVVTRRFVSRMAKINTIPAEQEAMVMQSVTMISMAAQEAAAVAAAAAADAKRGGTRLV